MKRTLLLLFTATILLLTLLPQPATAEPAAFPDNWLPSWLVGVTSTPITNAANTPNGANNPVILSRADASQHIIVFNKQVSPTPTDDDPFFSVSTDSINWSTPKAIFNSPGTSSQSAQVTAVFKGSAAYAVWVERSPTSATLAFAADQNTWPVSAFKTISTSSFSAGIKDPNIAAQGSNLHVAWILDFSTVKYALSSNDGNTWTTTTVTAAGENALPDMVVDDSGRVHIVWQKDVAGGKGEIWYAQGSLAGWSAPVRISEAAHNAVQPQVVLSERGVRIVYTDSVNLTPAKEQQLYVTECRVNCSVSSAWSKPRSLLNQFVGVNGDTPFFLVPTLAHDAANRVSYLYFHGTDIGGAIDDVEYIWGLNSCDSWSSVTMDRYFQTNSTERTVNPSISLSNNVIHLAYEIRTEVAPGQTTGQVYHMYGTTPGQCPYRLRLPVIQRN